MFGFQKEIKEYNLSQEELDKLQYAKINTDTHFSTRKKNVNRL